MDDRFMYQIRPRKPIINLIPGKGIRKPMSLKLTKEEVKKCISYGPDYRAFPSIPPIRVTGSNLDTLHVSEEDFLNNDKKETKPSNTTEKSIKEAIQEVVVPEEPKTEASTEEVKEEIHEEEKKYPYAYTTETPLDNGKFRYETTIIESKEQEERLKKEEVEEEPEPIPVPVEPGPVIPEEEVKEEEPIPVPVEPGPVIIEPEEPVIIGVVEEPTESSEVEEYEEDDEEEEEEDITPLGPVSNNNGQLQPHRKKKKKHH